MQEILVLVLIRRFEVGRLEGRQVLRSGQRSSIVEVVAAHLPSLSRALHRRRDMWTHFMQVLLDSASLRLPCEVGRLVSNSFRLDFTISARGLRLRLIRLGDLVVRPLTLQRHVDDLSS